jgi:hypothetical protein
LGSLNDERDDEAVLGIEPAPLRVGEARIGQCERGEIRDGLARVLEAFFQACAESSERRCVLPLGPHGRKRIAQQCRPLAF